MAIRSLRQPTDIEFMLKHDVTCSYTCVVAIACPLPQPCALLCSLKTYDLLDAASSIQAHQI